MKTKIPALITSILLISMLTTFSAMAQQPQYVRPENPAEQIAKAGAPANYTYRIFEAPNKMFGYDIFRNGSIIFHQGASTVRPNNSIAAIAKKEHAEKAALMVIEKIKKGEPATFTQEEIKKIIAQ